MNQAVSLFTVKDLTVKFNDVSVVDGISFDIHAGETFALVGESGSGKSMTALAALNLLPYNAVVDGTVMILQNDNLAHFSEQEWCEVRGRRIAIIFQDPIASLNPVMKIGARIAEVIQLHFNLPKQLITQRVVEFGWTASARHDCDGACRSTRFTDCRRAYHRLRCNDSSANFSVTEINSEKNGDGTLAY